MSLDKAIEHRKEKRSPYYGAGKFDKTCRPGGTCPWCQRNRKHKHQKKLKGTENNIKEWLKESDELSIIKLGATNETNTCIL